MGDHPLAGFAGYRMPGYTQIPDQLLDEQLHLLSHAELKVLLYIMRHTFGYKRDGDHLSARQIAEGLVRRDGSRVDCGTGCEIATVRRTVKRLEELGLITVRREKTADGDAEANYYTVRLTGGGGVAATPPGCFRDTRGVVSPRHPQDTRRSQDTEQQQQPPAKPRRKDPAPAATAVVAIASKAKATEHGDTRERLQALGVTRATAGKLIKDHGPDLVARWTAYTEHKLKSGWLPQESPAAWLVSALRAGDWIIPEWFATPEEQAAAAEAQAQEQAAQALARRQAEAEEQEQAAAQRRATEARLNIDPATADLWRQAVDLLTQRGEGSIALSSAYLLPVAGVEVARITSPVEFFCRMLAERREEIRRALSEVMGQQLAGVEVIKSEL